MDQNMKLLEPTSTQIRAIQDFREKHRGSQQFNHLSAVSESIAALGWVTVVSSSFLNNLYKLTTVCRVDQTLGSLELCNFTRDKLHVLFRFELPVPSRFEVLVMQESEDLLMFYVLWVSEPSSSTICEGNE